MSQVAPARRRRKWVIGSCVVAAVVLGAFFLWPVTPKPGPVADDDPEPEVRTVWDDRPRAGKAIAAGGMVLRFDTGDAKRDAEHKGKYKLDGKKLTYTLTTGAGERTETLTIKSLTATELVLVDPDGKVEEFKRPKK